MSEKRYFAVCKRQDRYGFVLYRSGLHYAGEYGAVHNYNFAWAMKSLRGARSAIKTFSHYTGYPVDDFEIIGVFLTVQKSATFLPAKAERLAAETVAASHLKGVDINQ